MSVVSAGDITRARASKHITCFPVLNLVPLVEVASAELAAAPVYPMTELAVTSTVTWSNCDVGRAFAIEDGVTGLIKMWGVQRKASAATVFYPDVKSRGDFGYAAQNPQDLAAGDILHVYKHRPAYGLISRATAEGAFKAWDIPYVGTGSSPLPQVNMGPHRQAWDAGSGYADLVLDCSASFDWLLGTVGIAEVEWILPAGASLQSGTVNDPVVTARFPLGADEFGCKVTSVNGRYFTGWRWVFINSKDRTHASAAFSQKYNVTSIDGDSHDRQGREMTFAVEGDIASEIYPGQMAVFTNYVYFDGVQLDSAVTTHNFVGYLDEHSSSARIKRRSATLRFYGPGKLTQRLPSATQLVEEVSAPAAWTEVVQGLSDPGAVAAYLLTYHSTLTINHDLLVSPKIRRLRRQIYGFRQETIGPQLSFLGELMVGWVGCRSDGTFVLRPNPMYLEDTQRDALDEKFTWTARDIRTPLEIGPKMRPDAAFIIRDAIAWDGAETQTFRGIAPGYAQTQGTSKNDETDIIVETLDDLGRDGADQLYAQLGHDLAYVNNPLGSIPIIPTQMLSIVEPADDDWHRLDVDAEHVNFLADYFGVDWPDAGFRWLPERVARSWQQNKGIWWFVDTITARAESKGKPGSFLPIDLGGGEDPDEETTDQITYPPDEQPPPDIAMQLAIVANDQKKVGRSRNFNAVVPSWTDITEGLEGDPLIGCWDAGVGGDAVLIVTWDKDADLLRIYHTLDVDLDEPTWTERATIDINGDGFTGGVDLASSNTVSCVAWLTNTGMKVRRRSTSGTTWNAEEVLLTGYTETAHPNERIGLSIDGDVIRVGAIVGDDEYKFYTATGPVGSWSEITGMPSSGNTSFLPIGLNQVSASTAYITLGRYVDTPGADTVVVSGNRYLAENAFVGYLRSDDVGAAGNQVYYGMAYKSSTNESFQDGEVYAVSGVEFSILCTLWYPPSAGDPPGPAGDPYEYFPPNAAYGLDFEMGVILYDKDNYPVYKVTKTFNSLSLTEADHDITYAPSPAGFSRIKFECTATIDVSFTEIPNVKYVEFWARSTETRQWGTDGNWDDDGLTLRFFEVTPSSVTLDISGRTIDERRLYKYNASTWTDITPEDSVVPLHPYGMVAESATLMLVGTNPMTGKRELHRSTDAATWTKLKDTSYQWVRSVGSGKYVAGGAGALDVSTNNFKVIHQRMTRWPRTIGAIGTPRWCIAKVSS